jgi:uncharacterized membrane protein
MYLYGINVMMMGTFRINLRTDKTTSNGQSPIEIIYQVRGQRKYYSPTILLLPVYWDQKSQKAIYVHSKQVKKNMPDLGKNDFLTADEVEDIKVIFSKLRKSFPT